MDAPPKAWRVNLSPRLTAAEFGEYMASDDGPRETILRDARYERLARSLLYRDVQQAATRFICSPIRDSRILAECHEMLREKRRRATDPTAINNVDHEIEALEKFQGALNAIGISGLQGSLVSNRRTALRIEGVAVSVWPTAWLTQARARGADQSGAVLIDFARGLPLRTDAAKAKARNAMEHVACLLHMKTQESRCVEGQKAANDICFVYHLHRADMVAAPSSYARKTRNMAAVCRVIARSWDDIKPPTNFDPADAIYRR